jgi:NAD dependent epimerase/dehydratase
MNFWKNKHVLVTGAGGFIGSTLVEAIAQEGAHVRAFVRYNSRGDVGLLRLVPAQTLKQIEIIAGDIRDLPAIEDAVAGMEVVFHLGALISIPYSYKHPFEVAETNFMGTLNVLAACRKHQVQRMVHTSTSEVYGTAQRVPIDESHPLQGQSPYSASKIGADKMAEAYYRSYNLPVVTVRPFNTYGPRQSARAIIPTIITQALTQDVIRLGNLNSLRDFTFVTDTVNGFLKAAEASGVEGETFNLGTGQEVSMGTVANEIIQKVGKTTKIEIDEKRLRPEKSEVQRLLSNNQLAQSRLNWQPVVSLTEGLDRTIDWIRDHQNFFRPGVYEF